MAPTRTAAKDHLAAAAPVQPASPPQTGPPKVGRKRHLSPFWRHFLEMLGAMAVGMVATGAIFLSVVGLKTWEQVTVQYPTQALLAMAAGMSVPMVAWMVFRGMGWRNAAEMAAAMVLPVLPFLCLVWFQVGRGAQCGAYCAVTVVAMLALMGYRRSQYSRSMSHRSRFAPTGQCDRRPGKDRSGGGTRDDVGMERLELVGLGADELLDAGLLGAGHLGDRGAVPPAG